jgi:hypothetical protein
LGVKHRNRKNSSCFDSRRIDSSPSFLSASP